MMVFSSAGAAGAAGMLLLQPHSGNGPPVSGVEFLSAIMIVIVLAAALIYYVTHYDPPRWMGK
jgi:hypothetical protein